MISVISVSFAGGAIKYDHIAYVCWSYRFFLESPRAYVPDKFMLAIMVTE